MAERRYFPSNSWSPFGNAEAEPSKATGKYAPKDHPSTLIPPTTVLSQLTDIGGSLRVSTRYTNRLAISMPSFSKTPACVLRSGEAKSPNSDGVNREEGG